MMSDSSPHPGAPDEHEPSRSQDAEEHAPDPSSDPEFPRPIVGIGASAGGINALRDFFDALPDDTGMAFVVVLHLAPDYESNLASILQKDTNMRVTEAQDGGAVSPNAVYIIPPKRRLTIQDGRLALSETVRSHEVSTVDRFFRSLATDQSRNAVGIILSGTGTDGTIGLRKIKERGGVAMVQAPADAEHDDMPRSAITAGLVDLILPAPELAEKLVQYRSRTGVIQLPEEPTALDEDGKNILQKIFTRLYTTTGHDFSGYKRSTVLRRLERRLQIRGVPTLGEYLDLLREDEREIRSLKKDLLISVTSFFRDPEAFEALRQKVIPELFEGKGPADQVRVWVPGCATGEEAYSIAMLLHEEADRHDHPPSLQIFATDVDDETLSIGREGRYPAAVTTNISEERLQRFFHTQGNYYQVDACLRDTLLFARHNLLSDPPFSNLDLVSCRNLLIYLNREMQDHVYSVIHYALKDSGYLFLGRSEAAGRTRRFFSILDTSSNILQARPRPGNGHEHIPLAMGRRRLQPGQPSTASPVVGAARSGDNREAVEALFHQVLMQEGASVLVDENQDIVHLSDRANRFLTRKGGTPTHNILASVSDALRAELHSALYQVLRKGRSVERSNLRAPVEGTTRRIHLTVEPVDGPKARYAHVRFEEATSPADETDERAVEEGEQTDEVPSETRRETELREELEQTREQLATTTEEYEAATEEMEATNEELLSMNEELQSKNEELETSKEELQSVNEELKTTNQELKNKVEEVRETNSDLKNLMAATEIATLFLDRDLRIQRFTPRTTDLFNIRPVDTGRPLSDFTQRFEYDGLLEEAETVMETLDSAEHEIRHSDGKWFLVRLRPYRTVQDTIEGVVLTFVDLTERKEAEARSRRRAAFHRLATRAGKIGTWDLNFETDACRLSPMMGHLMGYTGAPGEEEVSDPRDEQWRTVLSRSEWIEAIHPEDRPAMQAAIDRAEQKRESLDLEVRIHDPDGGIRWLSTKGEVSAAPEAATNSSDPEDTRGSLHLRGAAVDITEQKQTEQHLRIEKEYAEDIVHTVRESLLVVDEDLRVQSANESFFDHFQVEPEETLGRHLYDLGHGEWDIPELRQHLEAILSENTVFNDLQVEPTFEDLGRRIMKLNARRIANKELILLAIEDVTDRQTAIQTLRRERNFIDRVLDTVGTLVVIVDLDGRIVRVNSECAAVSGYSEEELEGTNVFDLIPSEEHDGVRTVISRHEEGVEQVFHENHWITNDGDGRLIRWSSTVLLDDDGDVQNIIGAGIDITERRKLERRLVTVADAEQRRIGLELHDMLASHLAGTAMIADGLADELKAGRDVSADTMQEVADLVREASEQTRLLSHSLMPLDMRADSLADGLERLAERTKKRSDVRCALDADDSVPDVGPDVASHLYRIAAEAVRNAVTHADPDTIRIRLELEDNHLVLTVRDDGPGIAKEIDTSDGFGIQMMRYRAELVGAVLSIRPTKEGGTVVTCRVPVSALSLADDGSSEET